MRPVAQVGKEMDSNTIYNKWYNSYGSLNLRNTLSKNIEEVIDNFKGNQGQIAVLNHLPRLGKTYSLLNYLNNTPNICALYVSDVLKQIEQISSNFNKIWLIKGAANICPLLNDDKNNNLNYLFSKTFKRNVACIQCTQYNECIYNKQFDYPKKDIILAVAKESLPNRRIHTSFDYIVFDEDMTKSKEIKPYCPNNMQIEFLDTLQYGETILDLYLELKHLIDERKVIDEEGLNYFKRETALLGSKNVIKTTLKEIGETKNFKNVLPFIANLHLSNEWIEQCYKVGEYRKRHFKPYIHSAFDLQKEYGCNLIIANATFDKDIFNLLRNQYETVLPEIKSISNIPIENKDSYIFNYNMLGRSCSRTGLKKYENEIYPIVNSIPHFCRKRGLKSGLITFPELEDNFNTSYDVVDHFIAHRGKNDFDKIDLLVILGTFNIDPQGLLANHYAISGEYLSNKQFQEWETITINGCKVSLPKYPPFRKTRLYKLYEEHLQAVLRSRAHTKSKKVVINFGYAPQGIENILTYKTFNSKRQLINGYLTRIFSKKRRKKKKR